MSRNALVPLEPRRQRIADDRRNEKPPGTPAPGRGGVNGADRAAGEGHHRRGRDHGLRRGDPFCPAPLPHRLELRLLVVVENRFQLAVHFLLQGGQLGLLLGSELQPILEHRRKDLTRPGRTHPIIGPPGPPRGGPPRSFASLPGRQGSQLLPGNDPVFVSVGPVEEAVQPGIGHLGPGELPVLVLVELHHPGHEVVGVGRPGAASPVAGPPRARPRSRVRPSGSSRSLSASAWGLLDQKRGWVKLRRASPTTRTRPSTAGRTARPGCGRGRSRSARPARRSSSPRSA